VCVCVCAAYVVVSEIVVLLLHESCVWLVVFVLLQTITRTAPNTPPIHR